MTDRKIPSKELSARDERLLKGYDDIVHEEPDQVIPPVLSESARKEKTEKTRQKLVDIKDKAFQVLNEIEKSKSLVDERCKDLKAVTNEALGTSLAQAMYRLFGEHTTTITYEHYKRALNIRTQLAREDVKKVKEL